MTYLTKNSAIWILIGLVAMGCTQTSQFSDSSSASTDNVAELSVFESRTRLMSRTYLKSVLLDVYAIEDLDSATRDDLEELTSALIGDNASAYGQACDPLNRTLTDAKNADLASQWTSECPLTEGSFRSLRNATGNSLASMVSQATSQGLTLITRTCDIFSAYDFILSSPINRMGYSISTRPGEPAIRATFDRFYPGKEPTDDVIQKLVSVSSSANSSTEAWRFVFLSLCYSPGWQIP